MQTKAYIFSRKWLLNVFSLVHVIVLVNQIWKASVIKSDRPQALIYKALSFVAIKVLRKQAISSYTWA